MKYKKITVFFFFIFICNVLFSQTVCSYKYRKRITFDPTKVSGPIDLTNFPALINISSDNDLRTVANSGHVESANGYDIIFTADDGVTLLNFQFEKYTALTGQYTAWVKIPSLSTSINTYIYMYYGNTAVVTDQSTTSVWSGYYGVWHMQNNSFLDSSPNGYNCTNNSSTNQNPAVINDGRATNGSQWLEVSSSFPNLTTNFSISGWAYTTNNATTGQRIFCDDLNDNGGYAMSIGDGGTGALRFYSRGSSNVILDSPLNAIPSNTWVYCVGVADISNGQKKLYVNGVLTSSNTFSGWGTDAGNSAVAGEASGSPESSNRLNGRIDEVRVSNTALSADWIATEYNNQSAPSTFYTISIEPKLWLGTTNGNWNTATNWSGGSVPTATSDVIIRNVNPANQPTLDVSPQVYGLWLYSGTTLSLSNRTLSVAYDITNCGTITGNTGMVNCNSGITNAQNQYFSGSGTYNLNNLTVNNVFSPNPKLVLNKDVNVSGALLLNSGIVSTTTTNILALGSGATSSSGSAASFVSGPMSKVGSADFVFPVGKGTKWRRAAVTNISASTTFRAEYFNNAFTNSTTVNAPLTNVSLLEFWQVDRTAGTGNANLSLYWESANLSGVNTCTDLTIARWNGAQWDERPGTTVAGSSCSGSGTGTITSNALITAFSPFTFGSKTAGNINPLPITLTDFSANCDVSGIVLKWITASEMHNNYFLIERSNDGIIWKDIAHIPSQGNSSVSKTYYYTDNDMDNENVYYRLSQVDYDGTLTRFKIIVSNCFYIENNSLTVYPNPAANQINADFMLAQNYGNGNLKIIDNLGKICFEQKVILTKGSSSNILPLNLKSGSYTILFSADQLVFPARKLIIR